MALVSSNSKGFGAVAAVGISSIVITTWMGTRVMAARKKYNVKVGERVRDCREEALLRWILKMRHRFPSAFCLLVQ